MMTFVLQTDWSPLHSAGFNGHLDIVRALIEAGASISQTNKVGTVLVNQCLFEFKLWLYNVLFIWLFLMSEPRPTALSNYKHAH